MVDVDQIRQLHRETVARWHVEPIDNPYRDFLAVVCEQHGWNYRLWHEEDIARSPTASAEALAQVKRNIDRYNQQRNDAMERVDDEITRLLAEQAVRTLADAPLNTETAGSVIDRLSILALRLYHLDEQLQRTEISPGQVAAVQGKLATCREQLEDVANSLRQLLADIFHGRKRHKTYRHLKMYNDPNLNPYLYASAGKQVTG